MIECTTTTRKWGNSLGITLPKEIVDSQHIKENETIQVLILKNHGNLKKTFGLARGTLKKSAQHIKDELRKELYHA